MSDSGPLFVFGYGSLMWRPDFPFRRRIPATAVGARRRLCVWSAYYRGSRERPGLVFGLDRDGGASDGARGMLYEVDAADRQATIDYLYRRELIYPIYRAHEIEASAEGSQFRALTFVVDRDDPAFAGELAAEARVAAIATGAGQAGRARDYLANTLARLRELGAPEPELEAELAEADLLGDEPERLFRLLDEGVRRRLDAVFQNAHEFGA